MSYKTRKITCALSITFVIGLYIFKGLPSFVSVSISDALPMLFTSLAVTGVKTGIVCGVIVIGNKIINILKSNSEKKQNNRDNFEIKNNNVKIKEKEKEQNNNINSKETNNKGTEVLDKPKILIKRK